MSLSARQSVTAGRACRLRPGISRHFLSLYVSRGPAHCMTCVRGVRRFLGRLCCSVQLLVCKESSTMMQDAFASIFVAVRYHAMPVSAHLPLFPSLRLWAWLAFVRRCRSWAASSGMCRPSRSQNTQEFIRHVIQSRVRGNHVHMWRGLLMRARPGWRGRCRRCDCFPSGGSPQLTAPHTSASPDVSIAGRAHFLSLSPTFAFSLRETPKRDPG